MEGTMCHWLGLSPCREEKCISECWFLNFSRLQISLCWLQVRQECHLTSDSYILTNFTFLTYPSLFRKKEQMKGTETMPLDIMRQIQWTPYIKQVQKWQIIPIINISKETNYHQSTEKIAGPILFIFLMKNWNGFLLFLWGYLATEKFNFFIKKQNIAEEKKCQGRFCFEMKPFVGKKKTFFDPKNFN